MSTPPVETRCTTCHRQERWQADGTQSILLAGGQRRPSEPAWAATWQVVRSWQLGGPAIVGICEACGQPLVSDSPGATALTGLQLALPTGMLTVGEWLSLTPADGSPQRVDIEHVDAMVLAHTPRASVRSFIGPISSLPFLLLMVALVTLIAVVWVSGATFFFTFIWEGFHSGGFIESPY